MSLARSAKKAILMAAGATGTFAMIRGSRWRSERLLILCYHGISKDDEHEWNPGLYIPQEKFRRRMEALRRGGYRVLPLDEAVRLLERGALPPRSVAITFDDGAHDFLTLAWPVLREFSYPATVYLTTYYCQNQRAVFDVVSSYVLWKGRGRTFRSDGILAGPGREVTLNGATGWREVARMIYQQVRQEETGAAEKDAMVEELARRLGVDYGRIREDRILYLMNPGEVKEISDGGISVELHTHRHRTPRDRALFTREIEDNRRAIQEITGREPSHFCYPSGDYTPDFFGWLRECGVRSATTCVAGLSSRASQPLELPRLLDVNTLTDIEFVGWLTGFSEFIPSR